MPLSSEQFDRTLNSLLLCLNTCPSVSGGTPEWFISFGTLLGYIRERGNNIGDIDISMFEEDCCSENLSMLMCQFNFVLDKKIIDSRTGHPYQMSFSPSDKQMYGDNHVDVFFWKKINGIYYHCYDFNLENPSSGIPGEYVYKGVSPDILRGPTWHYEWPNTKHVVRLPQNYGSLLDYWYPGWYKKDAVFGQSRSEYIVKVKSPEEMDNASLINQQIEKSKEEYKLFKDEYAKRVQL